MKLGSDCGGHGRQSPTRRPMRHHRPGRQTRVRRQCLPVGPQQKRRWKLECKTRRDSKPDNISTARITVTVGVGAIRSGSARLHQRLARRHFVGPSKGPAPPLPARKTTCHPKPGDDVKCDVDQEKQPKTPSCGQPMPPPPRGCPRARWQELRFGTVKSESMAATFLGVALPTAPDARFGKPDWDTATGRTPPTGLGQAQIILFPDRLHPAYCPFLAVVSGISSHVWHTPARSSGWHLGKFGQPCVLHGLLHC